MASAAAVGAPEPAAGVAPPQMRTWLAVLDEKRATGNPNFLEMALNEFLMDLMGRLSIHDTSPASHKEAMDALKTEIDNHHGGIAGLQGRLGELEVAQGGYTLRLTNAENVAANAFHQIGQRLLADEGWCGELRQATETALIAAQRQQGDALAQVVTAATEQFAAHINRVQLAEGSIAQLQASMQQVEQAFGLQQAQLQQQQQQASGATASAAAPPVPGLRALPDPVFIGDPWPKGKGKGQSPPGPAQGTYGATTGFGRSDSDVPPYHVNTRDWGDHKRLALVTEPQGYLAWKDRALGFLGKNRRDISELLVWAESQEEEVTTEILQRRWAQMGSSEDSAEVDYTLHAALKHIITDE